MTYFPMADIIEQTEAALRSGTPGPGGFTGLARALVAELKATRLCRQVAEALGFVETVEGVGEVVTGSDGDLLDNLRHLVDIAREHDNCPVWCDSCEHFEQSDSCPRCSGSGCGPGTASGAYDPCRDCDGDGRDHNFAYVHIPDLEAELKATRAQLDRRNRQVLCPHSIIESFDIEPPILVCCDCGADCSIGRPRVLDPDPLGVRRDG